MRIEVSSGGERASSWRYAEARRFARVVRFRHALGLLQRATPATLTAVAFEAGFYDQPHMNAEFRALGGLTPTEFLRRRHPVGDGSTAADG